MSTGNAEDPSRTEQPSEADISMIGCGNGPCPERFNVSDTDETPQQMLTARDGVEATLKSARTESGNEVLMVEKDSDLCGAQSEYFCSEDCLHDTAPRRQWGLEA